ncbi:probable addiction module antidote protein [Hoeflea halophila]|uniref:Probable addiction module antidote protein n=1 Tax=Hoeflea halophila TaxID=714899 RepID=A0A286IDR7_9HYPH|nr:addiction module antidote protein [Hoeflea halophila]SOE17479.1 probable addiction module antidote protein [Hoeflea halophila]
MAIETQQIDITEFIDSPEMATAYLDAALIEGDPALFAAALGDIAKARGMSDIARKAGVTREALYNALGETGDPRLSTLIGVIKALGLK